MIFVNFSTFQAQLKNANFSGDEKFKTFYQNIPGHKIVMKYWEKVYRHTHSQFLLLFEV